MARQCYLAHIVQLAQARTTGSNDVVTKRKALKNMPLAARNVPTAALPPAFLEISVNTELRIVSQVEQTLSKPFIQKYLHTHTSSTLLAFAKCLLNDYNTYTKL